MQVNSPDAMLNDMESMILRFPNDSEILSKSMAGDEDVMTFASIWSGCELGRKTHTVRLSPDL